MSFIDAMLLDDLDDLVFACTSTQDTVFTFIIKVCSTFCAC